jgi:UPF0755 protein
MLCGVLMVGALALAAALALQLHALLEPGPPGQDPVVVSIPPGATTAEIGSILQDAGLVKSGFLFRVLVELRGHDGQLRAGEYELPPGSSLNELVRRLVRGHVVTYPFTVPEGLTVEQIAALAEQRGLADRDRFLAAVRNANLVRDFLPEGADCREPLEGYLFPDTYNLPRGATEELVVRAMISRFAQVFDDELRARARDLGLTVHQVATLASIIEREAMVDDERPLISGVYHNRLRVGMRLHADPTVLYALGRTGGPLLYRDLDVDSPYNTYRYAGLPPGPISNFGRASLLAALYPAETEYFYFVARNDGTHDFSVTYSEHLEKVRKYQR